jgi:serine/threonine-protein kinase
MIGRQLGHFRIVELLGSGGMGQVYRAQDERLHRAVALKVLPPGTITDASARERFRREALALAQINHPNVATLYDFDSQDGVDFLAMELVEGQTLTEFIARRAPLEESDVRALGIQLADGLTAAHERGIVHRDLKPANLRITPDGRLKVLDFGLAKARIAAGVTGLPTLTEAGTVAGTLSHMAPEQLLGEPVDERTDLYAAGMVLYELATGRHPYSYSDPARLMHCILHERPEPPSRWNPPLSAALDDTILRLMEKHAEGRPASAAVLRDELRDELRGGARAAIESGTRPMPMARPDAPASGPAPRAPSGARARRRWMPPALGAGAVALAALLYWGWSTLSHSLGAAHAGHIRSLAVLPLDNLSHDADQEFFAEGMTDEIITSLAQVSGLRVISRTSAMRFRGTTLGPQEIARALHVDALVEGAVLKAGERVRINAELIDASSDQNLWAQSFERDLRDVLALQSDVARSIAERIRIQLTPVQAQRLAVTRQVNPEAYQDYLRGRYAWGQYTRAGFDQAYQLFHRAIEIDSTYAPAYAGLADAYYGNSSIFLPPNQAIPQARAAALKALALDSLQAPAHVSLGIVRMVYDLDWAGAEREFRRAVELQPNDADAHLWLGHLLSCRGEFDDGLTEIRHALDLDPLSSWIRANLGWHLYYARRYAEAEQVLRAELKTEPDYYSAAVFLGQALAQQGQYDEAIDQLSRAVTSSPNNDNQAQLAQVLGLAGRKADAEQRIQSLIARSKTEFVPAGNIGAAYSGLGKRDEAFHWLGLGFEDHSEWMIFLKVDPGFDPLRSDPRYAAMLRRAGLQD